MLTICFLLTLCISSVLSLTCATEPITHAKKPRDLIMIFDATKSEDPAEQGKPKPGSVKGYGIITEHLSVALFAQAAPVLVSTTQLRNYCAIACDPQLRRFSREYVGNLDAHWIGFQHKETDLILLLPIQYLPDPLPDSNAEILAACGFKDGYFNRLERLNEATPPEYLDSPESVAAVLIGTVFSADAANRWFIYLAGHGSAATAGCQPQIAGLSFSDFQFLLGRTLIDIHTDFFYYTTCYAGGYNQALVSAELAKIKAPFITVAEGVGNLTTTMDFISLSPTGGGDTTEVTVPQDYKSFFTKLHQFFGYPSPATRHQKPASLTEIVRTVLISKKFNVYNQPFVRFPQVGIFGALAIDKHVKILTAAITKSYAFTDNKFKATDAEAILVVPTYINMPISIGEKTKIISIQPPADLTDDGTTKHYFADIIDARTTTFPKIIENIVLNIGAKPQHFFIKDLLCKNFVQSGSQHSLDSNILVTNIHIEGQDGGHFSIKYRTGNRSFTVTKFKPFASTETDDWSEEIFNEMVAPLISDTAVQKPGSLKVYSAPFV